MAVTNPFDSEDRFRFATLTKKAVKLWEWHGRFGELKTVASFWNGDLIGTIGQSSQNECETFGFISIYDGGNSSWWLFFCHGGLKWWASLYNDYVNLCDDVSWMIEVSASWMLDTNWTCYYYMSEQWRMRYRETTRELAHRAVIFGKKWLWCTQHQLGWVLQEIPASKELTALRGLVK